MVGDAAAFVDPLFSTGVLLAINGAKFAAEHADAALTDGNFAAERFAGYQAACVAGMDIFRTLIAELYTENLRKILMSSAVNPTICSVSVSVQGSAAGARRRRRNVHVESRRDESVEPATCKAPIMTRLVRLVIVALVLCLFTVESQATPSRPVFGPRLQSTIDALLPASRSLPDDRKAELKKLATYVRDARAAGRPVKLLFICTHNSRRSQMAQLWAAVAAAYYGLDAIHTFSGGMEATAFNPRAVAALQRAGFDMASSGDTTNPHYRVTLAAHQTPLELYSKKYSDAVNPQSDFAAVMTCAHADQSCPLVAGASLRVALHYDDPKDADGTASEAATYDARARQIGSEMMYLFSEARR